VALVTAPSSPATEAPPVPAPPPAVEAGPWRVVRDLPTARQQVAGAVTDGTLWVIGGLVGDSASAKVEGYDPAIDTWKSAPDLPLPLHHAMAVTYRGELVVLGGWTPQGANLSGTASNRVFALRGGTWSELPPLTRPRAAGAAAVVDDRIVVVGGQANGALVAPSEVFDGTRWADAPPLPTPRDHLAAVSDGSFVYAVGGRFLSADANVATVERYDPVARRWSRLPDMPTARGGLGADLVGRRIVAVGGERPTGVFDTVEALDLDSRAWTALPAMRTPRHGMAVLAAGSSIYALGGSLQPTHAHAATTAEVLDLRP
jgi:non-specific serine/threonine protein kinase